MRFHEINSLTEQTLTEINMSPSNLRSLAAQINAKAGMEFEMIVPNAAGDNEESDNDLEPDYDADENTRDIDSIISFFHDGDNNGRNEVNRLQSRLQDDYGDWMHEKMSEDWQENGQLFLEDYIKNNEFDMDAAKEAATNDIKETNPELPEHSEEFANQVNRHAYNKLSEVAEESWDSHDSNYDYAREEFDDEKRDEFDESEWLADAGLDSMSDIERRYDIMWPHWTSVSNNYSGGRSIEEIADDFSGAIGRPINHSTKYHGAKRTTDGYVVEPDGSLDGDDVGDAGLEFVSPPLPVAELLSDLQKVKQWATKEGAYTGEKNGTGLHINVSVDGWEGNMEQLDFVKLAILLGDDYILKQFERQANTYCKSAIGLVQTEIAKNPAAAAQLLNQMKSHLNSGASKLIHTGTTSKFTSINTKTGYIEFRSPGGDWLNDKFELIEPTLLRCVVALDAAVKPDLYKQEYLKKLYKLLLPAGSKDTMAYFAKFVAGEIPQSALKSFVRQAQLERKNLKGGTIATAATVDDTAANPGAAYKQYTVQDRSGYQMLITANSALAAQHQALSMYPDRFQEVVSVLLYEPRGQATTPVPGSTIDLQQQRAAAARASNDAHQAAASGQQWKIMMGDQQVFTITAATQGEANRAASNWLSQRSPEFNQAHVGQEVEVLPVQS